MSATMNLLKGANKTGAAKSSKMDEELSDEASPVEDTATPEEAADDQSEGDSAEVALDGDDEVVTAEPAEGVAIPTSKTEVHALKQSDLPGVAEALGLADDAFYAADLKGKKQIIMEHLFPTKGKAKIDTGDDKVQEMASEIEKLTTRAEVEAVVDRVLEQEGELFFRKGGLLVKLSEIGDYGEHENFRDYVSAQGWAPDYRTARYWMSIYNKLLEIGIPYTDIKGIGWTKINIIVPVLDKENAAEWLAKAKSLTAVNLKAMVDAELKGAPSAGQSESSSGEIKSMVFKVHQDQYDTINDALAKAKANGNTEVKEVALDYICLEYLGNAPSKPTASAAEPVGYDPDNLDVGAFLRAMHEKFPDPGDAVGFFFAPAPDEAQPDGEDGKSWFELLWPTVDMKVSVLPAE
jgi:hypothetical protein